MLVSHAYKFVLFHDPMGSAPWMSRALLPWLDQPVASARKFSSETTLFHGMTPEEAELAFDLMGLSFRSYTRIAIIRNPFAKMAQIYDRIAASDPLWRARENVGLSTPRFAPWLKATKPSGNGAGYKFSSRWRRYGAWSADEWCGDRISHIVRGEDAASTLLPIFQQLGLSPAFGNRPKMNWKNPRIASLYNARSRAIIQQRYQTDLALYRVDWSEMDLAA